MNASIGTRKIRVLVVDDTVVIRKLLSEVLASDQSLEIAGTAANGRIGLAKIPQVNPDVITLDVEMPEMDGLETLREIRKLYPKLPVIMFSTLTERGAKTTIEALSLGANDYVTKPSNVGSVTAAIQNLREQLIPKIKHFCGRAVGLPAETSGFAPRPVLFPVPAKVTAGVRAPRVVSRPVEVLAIGVSTGGPNALAQLIPALPQKLPVPVVIVQHMPPIFTRLLAERLNLQSPLTVREAVPGSVLRAGEVWLAAGDWHMVVERIPDGLGGGVRINSNQQTPENSCRPAVDVLFRSIAAVYGSRTLAVILTGMGQDGLRGCRQIYDAGGEILAQDEASSVVWGMPGYVAQAGIADKVLPLGEMAAEISRRTNPMRINACH